MERLNKEAKRNLEEEIELLIEERDRNKNKIDEKNLKYFRQIIDAIEILQREYCWEYGEIYKPKGL
jgi:hypothetical protein